MAERFDEMKGRAKEAAGDLTDDKDLQREGKVDQAAGKTKDKLDHARDKLEGGVERAKEKAHDVIE